MKFTYYIIFILFLISSCKKEHSNKSDEYNLIKTKTTSTSTEHYFYDAQNRVSRIDFYTNHSDTVSYYYTYLYTDSAIYEYHSNEAISSNYDSIFINCDKNPHKFNLQYNRYFMHLNDACFSWSEGYTYFPDGFLQTSYDYGIDGGGRDTFYNDGVNYIYSKGNFAGMTGFGDDQHTYYWQFKFWKKLSGKKFLLFNLSGNYSNQKHERYNDFYGYYSL
jgi:hypothetical protein